MGRPPRRHLQEETRRRSAVAAQPRIGIGFSSGGPPWMAKKHNHNASNKEVDTQGCRCCERRQDARQSSHPMLEGPQPDHMCQRECGEQFCHNPPTTQHTSPAKRRAPHLCSLLLCNHAPSAMETSHRLAQLHTLPRRQTKPAHNMHHHLHHGGRQRCRARPQLKPKI
jgi:hypothetical protein